MSSCIFDKNYFDEIYSKLICQDNSEWYSKNSKEVFESMESLNFEFKNRFCMTNYADELFNHNGDINPSYFDFLKKFSRSNIALICTSGLDVEAVNNNFCKKNIEILKDFLHYIHSFGTKIFLTLKTSRGRISKIKHNNFLTSASFNHEYYHAKKLCFPVLDSKCKKLAKKFAIAGEFAQKVGFDGIVIDGSLSNLLGEFTSNEFNRRNLGYFSSREDMPKKIFDKLNDKIKNYPIIYKITPFSFFNDCFLENKPLSLKGVKYGLKIDGILEFFSYLVNLGVDGFMFEFGSIENEFLSQFSPFMGYNLYEEFYNDIEKYFKDQQIKNKFGEDVLIICSDNFKNFSCDKNSQRMYEVSREIYADLDFIKNIREGNKNINCIRCGICKKEAIEKNIVSCAINPQLNYELSNYIVDSLKKIAVVGAGISGIISAITLAERGFVIDLFEKQDEINKFGRSCEIFGFDRNLSNFNNIIQEKLMKFAESTKINIKLNTEFLSKNATDYDVLILATGFKELFLGVPGAVLKSVASIFDVLTQKVEYRNKKHIVIYGKSELSFKLAIFLAKNNHDVYILIKNSDFLMEMSQNLLSYYLIASKKLKIKIFVSCEIKNINEDSVEFFSNHKTRNLDYISLISNMRSGMKYKFEPQAKVIDCNMFIYDPNVVPNNKLYYEIIKKGYKGEVYMVGDCLEISNLAEEIKSAYFVGNNI